MDTDILKFSIEILSNQGNEISEKKIAEALIENQSKFESYFLRLIDNGDSRLEIQMNSMIVGDVKVSNKTGYAEIEYGWGCYMGCKDMNEEGSNNTHIEFDIVEGSLIFEIILPPAWKPDDWI